MMRTMEGQNTILLVPLILIFIYTVSISYAKQATYKFKNENLLHKYLKIRSMESIGTENGKDRYFTFTLSSSYA